MPFIAFIPMNGWVVCKSHDMNQPSRISSAQPISTLHTLKEQQPLCRVRGSCSRVIETSARPCGLSRAQTSSEEQYVYRLWGYVGSILLKDLLSCMSARGFDHGSFVDPRVSGPPRPGGALHSPGQDVVQGCGTLASFTV